MEYVRIASTFYCLVEFWLYLNAIDCPLKTYPSNLYTEILLQKWFSNYFLIYMD